MARLLTRSDTCSLDPVGARLALDGRLSSGESREGLTGALRQASQQSAELQATAAAAEDGSIGDAAPTAPTLLSSRPHQLPAELMDAFQAGEEQEHDACSLSDSSSSTAPALSVMREHRGSKSSGGVQLSQQDSLLHPPLPVARTRSQPGGHSSGIAGGPAGAAASSPPQRPPVTAAIERTSTATLDANGGVDHGVGMHDPGCTCPPYAVKSTCGKRPNMEDTYALCPNICQLPMSPMAHEYADKLPHRIAVQFENHCMHMPVPDGQQPQQQQQQQQPPHLNGATSPPAAAANGVLAAAERDAGQPQQPHDHLHQQQQQRQQQLGQQPLPMQRRCSHTPEAAAALQPQQLDPLQQSAAAAAAAAGVGALEDDTAAAFAGSASLVPGQLAAVPVAENSVGSLSSSEGGSVEKLHFFGVYDGHGGIEASQHCAQRLHYHLSKAVAELASGWLESSSGDEAAGSWNPEVRYVPLETARVGDSGSPGDCQLAATAAAEDTEAAAAAGPSSSGTAAQSMSSSSSGSSGDDSELGRSGSQGSSGNSGGSGSSGDCEVDSNEGSSAEGSEGTATSFCGLMEEVLRDAFLKTDEEFSNSGLQAGLVGSTAVVALVGTHRVWIANCGDSRAVLSRAGVAVQVTDDHKPEREDEAERVEKAGGQVLYWNGHRVMGVLAMSRAIGDHCLRPYVIPEPEISVFARHPRDEILLLASDGLWDVLSNQDATDLALRSIKRAREKGASRKAAARVAATVLTKAAVDRGSRDNITVVIIDLAPAPAGSEQQRPCGDKAALAATAAGIAPQLSDSGGEQQQTTCGPGADADGAAAAASGSGSRPSSSGSSKGAARTGSVKGSGSGSNPFAAAAASPFSTAATGSSELPLPSGASGSASAAGNEALAAAGAATAAAGQAPDRSVRSSAGSGRLRGAGTSCALGGSSSASTATAVGASAGMGASGTGGSMQQPEAQQQTQRQGFVELMSNELDSIDLSGMGAAAPRRRSRLTSIDSMAKGSSAAEGSTTSSSLEEQPTIVEPPPALVPPALVRQASSSPFSAFQGSIPFSDGGAETVC